MPRPDIRRRLRLGGWAGVLGPVLYIATWAVAGIATSGYDPGSQAISELAAIGAPTRAAMTAAFVVFGLLALPFADALRLLLPSRAGRAAAVAAVVSGLATAAAGALPCSAGCPGPDGAATDVGHSIAATVGYLALMATPLLAGWALARAGHRAAGALSCAVGAVGAALLVVWAAGLFGDAGGWGQRGFNTLADVWWVAAGAAAVGRSSRPQPPDAVSSSGPGLTAG